MEPRQLRDKANEALTKGRFTRAAELFEEYCQLDPKDFQARVRMGDAWVKVGNNARAITAYQAAAEGFAREGFLPRAIAASKLILELDPSHQGVQQMLAGLYARRGGAGGASRANTPAPTPVKQAAAIVPPPPPKTGQSALYIELPPELDETLARDEAAETSTGDAGHSIPGFLPTSYSQPTKASTPPVAKAAQPVAPSEPVAAQARQPTIEVVVTDLDDATSELVAAQAREPTVEVVVTDLDDTSSEPTGDVEVELDLSDAEQGSVEAAPPPQPTVALSSAPPGLRRRSSEARPSATPAPVPPPEPLRVAAVPAGASRIERFTPQDGVDFQPPVPGSTPFTELAVEADSLLHAVEMAAMAGAGQQPEPVSSESTADEPGAADEPGVVVGEEPVSEAPAPDGGLPKIPLFSDLPRDAFIALFERCPLRRFPEGARIIEQGSRGDAFYVICAGSVRIVRQTGDEQRELAVLGEGTFFGEMALLSGAPRSASVVGAAEETQVLEISAPVLAALSRRYPQVARALRRFCRQRLLSDVVNTSAIFQPFGRKDRRELVERFRAREVRRGDVIIQEGQPVDGLYVVLSGEVAVSKGGQSLAQLREGELFGEMSLLQKAPASATVTAARNTSLLRLPREDFDTLILTHPQILALVSDLTETRQRSNEALLGGHKKVADETAAPHEELWLF